jgi:sulfotransferase family protein
MNSPKAPVFVLGSARSGTTLLYHMLLSSGGFAVYRAESHVYNLIVPRFGDLNDGENRRRLMKMWLRSHQYRVSGLDAQQIEQKIMAECRSGGDFLRIVMEEIARKQGVDRWAESTPEHLLYLDQIKREFPNARVIHIIRDGRDVALSYVKQGWTHPLPWDKQDELLVAGMYWKWIVRKGRENGRQIAPDYMEIHFEDLVNRPQEVLAKVSEFIDHPLDYDKIQQSAIGSVSKPNTSFETNSGENGFNPVGRWKDKFSPEELARFEMLVGDLLEELGYPLGSTEREKAGANGVNRFRAAYPLYFDVKLWLKSRTPLRRFTSTTLLEEGP